MKSLCVVCALSLALAVETYAADVLRYTLRPGSTITPTFAGDPSGSTEPLTGDFDWVEYDIGVTTTVGFDAVRLDFHSPSYTLILNTTVNDRASSVNRFVRATTLGEIVDVEGLGSPVVDLSCSGSYSGPPERPDSLRYQGTLSPVGGGFFLAHLTLVAELTEVFVDPDDDDDGVLDGVDLCEGTAQGATVDGDGCSIDQLVPCAGPRSGGLWKHHGEYVAGIVEAAGRFLSDGRIGQEERSAIVASAAQSTCGREQSVPATPAES